MRTRLPPLSLLLSIRSCAFYNSLNAKRFSIHLRGLIQNKIFRSLRIAVVLWLWILCCSVLYMELLDLVYLMRINVLISRSGLTQNVHWICTNYIIVGLVKPSPPKYGMWHVVCQPLCYLATSRRAICSSPLGNLQWNTLVIGLPLRAQWMWWTIEDCLDFKYGNAAWHPLAVPSAADSYIQWKILSGKSKMYIWMPDISAWLCPMSDGMSWLYDCSFLY